MEGFFNANAAHPYENPTPLSNFIQMLSIFLIPSGLTYYLGRKVRNQKHGWAVWSAMAIVFLAAALVCWRAESAGNPRLQALGIDPAGGNMEGKEVRFGVFNSSLFATVTTAASCGAVNAMHDSFTPLGGLVPLVNIQLGEIIFGGVGSGLYGMLVFVILAVFLTGLMVGRTPEYLGKKIESYDVKVSVLAVLILIFSILGFSAWATVSRLGLAGLSNAGPHGLSEILYAFSSGTGNNGSAFAGLNGNTPLYNITLALAMLFGRFIMMVPVLALAGNMARKKLVPTSEASFPLKRPDIRHHPHRDRPRRRRAHLSARPGPRSHRRASPDDRIRGPVLKGESTCLQRPAVSLIRDIIGRAVLDAVRKLNPVHLLRNPVIFVTEVGALLTTLGLLTRSKGEPAGFVLQVSLWLWFTVLFANFAEAMAEGRGKAQANELRKTTDLD